MRVRRPDIFQSVMEAIALPNVIAFGAAAPDDLDMPGPKLASLTNAVLRRLGSAAFRYTMSPGRKELRVALSRRLLSAGMEVSPDEIVSTQGATEAVSLALKATTKAGNLIAVESPTYFGILPIIKD